MPLIRVPQFRSSQRLYAINPGSFTVRDSGDQRQKNTGYPLYRAYAEAIWFKKTKGTVAIHIGNVWDIYAQETPPTLEDMITRYSTARYGGNVLALWDGSRFWSNDIKGRDEQDALIARLNPMLENYPEIPEGWLGWFKMED